MSVAPRAAPSTSERSMVLSRRGSNRQEEDLTVGAVVVMLSDKAEEQSAAAYRMRHAYWRCRTRRLNAASNAAPQKE
ncbi:hypothetical protein ON010_g11027 [Phytophthora cinnamomi]|nr:hypothetical protein ON010_g11027 [Phytophthora cinnamomi]